MIGEPGAARLVVGSPRARRGRRRAAPWRRSRGSCRRAGGRSGPAAAGRRRWRRSSARRNRSTIEHARHLDHAPQLDLAPPAADVRARSALTRFAVSPRSCVCVSASERTCWLSSAYAPIRDFSISWSLASTCRAIRASASTSSSMACWRSARSPVAAFWCSSKRRLRELEERLVVALQRLGRERAERLRQLLARAFDLRQLAGRRLALHPERGGQALGPAVQLGDRGAGLVEPRGLGGERARAPRRARARRCRRDR